MWSLHVPTVPAWVFLWVLRLPPTVQKQLGYLVPLHRP